MCRRRSSGRSVPHCNTDRKSTRLNSSHRCISYAVFCLKKKKKTKHYEPPQPYPTTIRHPVQPPRTTRQVDSLAYCAEARCGPVSFLLVFFFFFFNDTATTEIYTLSLHDALPIFHLPIRSSDNIRGDWPQLHWQLDRKSTRLNSSHRCISYAVFCLKKKHKKQQLIQDALPQHCYSPSITPHKSA